MDKSVETGKIKSSHVFISDLDFHRFGIKTAKAPKISSENIDIILDFCTEKKVELLIARCDSNELKVVQKMEKNNFFLTDTLVFYEKKLNEPLQTSKTNVSIRPFHLNDIDDILDISKKAFSAYQGHYHADPHLARKKCDEVYVSWAERSCQNREVADEILIAEENSKILGFATLQTIDKNEGQGVLYAVSPEAQGKGIYRAFMIASFEWGAKRGFKKMIYSTQITNIAVQKVWVRLGAEPRRSEYTFHKWFR